jgi:hypothetical protein
MTSIDAHSRDPPSQKHAIGTHDIHSIFGYFPPSEFCPAFDQGRESEANASAGQSNSLEFQYFLL